MNLQLLTCLVLFTALPVSAQEYEISLHRPHTVGAKERISVVGKEIEELYASAEGRVMRQEKRETTVDLEGVSTVLAVGNKGKIARLSVQIDKLVHTQAGVSKNLLPKGTVVIASRPAKKMIFEINGKAVETNTARALGIVLSVGDPATERTDDELFGTAERKRVGETWSINKPAVTAMMNDDPRMKITDITGTVTLKDVLKDASGEHLLVAFETKGKPAPPQAAGGPLPEGFVIMKGTAELPVNAKLQRRKESTEMRFSITLKGRPDPNGPEMLRRMLSVRSTTASSTPIK